MPEAVAYLVSQYPAISHTFVEREIAALRDLGVGVRTFSVRPWDPSSPFSDASRAEAAATRVIQGRRPAVYVASAIAVALRNPRGTAAALRLAARSGPGGTRGRLWQAFYLLEAMYLYRHLRRSGVHRLHVHHANNAADIARLVVALGNGRRPAVGWSWTLALHGPTEFLDAPGHDLPAKLTSARAVACISDYARAEAMRLTGEIDPARFGIVRMSAPADRFVPLGATRRALPPGSPLRVLFVGRLVADKAPDALVAAVERLLRAGAPVRAVIVGDGPLRGALERDVVRRGLEQEIRLVGAVGQTELPRYYAETDVFCLPSLAEGVPVVLMEAMLTELPVVTTRVAGIPELVDAGSGLLVPPGDVDALAEALLRMHADPELRHRMGVAGRLRVLAEFDAHENAVRLKDLLLPS